LGDWNNQAIWLKEDGVVEYISEGDEWLTHITPEMVKGIHPVDLFHVIGMEGYSDAQVGLYKPDVRTNDIVRHLTGYDVVHDETANNNWKPIGPPTPNGTLNFYRAVKAKG